MQADSAGLLADQILIFLIKFLPGRCPWITALIPIPQVTSFLPFVLLLNCQITHKTYYLADLQKDPLLFLVEPQISRKC